MEVGRNKRKNYPNRSFNFFEKKDNAKIILSK